MRRGFSLRRERRAELFSRLSEVSLAIGLGVRHCKKTLTPPSNYPPTQGLDLIQNICPNFALWQHFGNVSSLCWA